MFLYNLTSLLKKKKIHGILNKQVVYKFIEFNFWDWLEGWIAGWIEKILLRVLNQIWVGLEGFLQCLSRSHAQQKSCMFSQENGQEYLDLRKYSCIHITVSLGELNSRRRSNSSDITGLALRPCFSTTFDFIKNFRIYFRIQNIFVLLNKRS